MSGVREARMEAVGEPRSSASSGEPGGALERAPRGAGGVALTARGIA